MGLGLFKAQVNAAEAEFWRRSQGTRVDYSDKVLAFECGGQQWVNEVCFPVGTLKEPNDKDLDYMVNKYPVEVLLPRLTERIPYFHWSTRKTRPTNSPGWQGRDVLPFQDELF